MIHSHSPAPLLLYLLVLLQYEWQYDNSLAITSRIIITISIIISEPPNVHRSLSSALGFRVQRVGGHPLSSLVVLGQDFLLIEDRLESGPWLLAPLFWGVEYKLPSEEYPVNDVYSFLWRLISGNFILLQCLGCRFGLVQGTITSHPKPSEEKDA